VSRNKIEEQSGRMADNINRKFQGVWLPRWLYLHKDFTWTEKILIVEINSLDRNNDGCFASNQHLAKFLNSTAGHVANVISKLRKSGYIEDVESSANKRHIKLSDELKSKLGCYDDNEMKKGKNPVVECPQPDVADEIEVSPTISEEKQKFTIKRSKNKESIELILEFWNQRKGHPPWKSHEKISYDMAVAINEALKHYNIQEICAAIDNYAEILLDDKYYWSHAWSLSIFLSVKNGIAKDAPKKWYQFLPENFVKEGYLINKPSKSINDGEYDQTLVDNLIKAYGCLINNKSFIPNQRQKHKFVESSKMAKEFFERCKIPKENWVKHIVNCLNNVYIEKGEVLYPGHFSSDNTWNVLLPQYVAELGIGI